MRFQMKNIMGFFVIVGLATTIADIHAQPSNDSRNGSTERRLSPARSPAPHSPLSRSVMPLSEAATDGITPFATSPTYTPMASLLQPPVKVTYGGNSPTVLIETTGSNKGLESLISNSKNISSAVFGQTNGAGSGVTGTNVGILGPSGKFQNTNSGNKSPAVLATSVGNSPAIFASNTAPFQPLPSFDNPHGPAPAIYAESLSLGYSTAVLGEGTFVGVWGDIPGTDNIEGVGVYGTSDAGTGVSGYSASGTAGNFYSDHGLGIAVETSAGGTAGVFIGDVTIDGTLTVGSTSYTSDRRLKTDARPADGRTILEKLDQLPISSWVYQIAPTRRHLGPMAQDFHAAFQLNGDDETHISEVDVAGVSLVAIQELSARMKTKDAQIAELQSQISDLTKSYKALASMLQNHGANNLVDTHIQERHTHTKS